MRLLVGKDMPKHVLEILLSNFEIERTEVYRIDGPLGLKRLMCHLQPRSSRVEGPALRARAAAGAGETNG